MESPDTRREDLIIFLYHSTRPEVTYIAYMRAKGQRSKIENNRMHYQVITEYQTRYSSMGSNHY